MNHSYKSLKMLVKTYQNLLPQDCRIFNADSIPPGAKIIAANHPNVTDTFHVALAVRDELHTLIMGDVFSIPVLGWLLAESGQIPVYTGQKGAALQKSCEILAAGGTVLIYPEAQLNPAHRRMKGKSGAVRMSLISRAPIVPLGIYVAPACTRELRALYIGRPRQGRWQTTGLCTLYFGKPWLPSDEIRGENDVKHIHDLTDQLMDKIYSLSQKAHQEWLRERLAQPVLSGWQDAFIDRQGVKEIW
jgi:1-acyl-sn-glycerol-3-phosphate acyltransferase